MSRLAVKPPSTSDLIEEERQRFEHAAALRFEMKAHEVRAARFHDFYPSRPALDLAWEMWRIAVGLAQPQAKSVERVYMPNDDKDGY